MLICIAHQKGGTSKSTVCANLSIELQNKFKKKTVEVVDLDVQQTLTLNNITREMNKDLKPLRIRNFTDAEKLKDYFNDDSDEKIIIVDTGGFDSSLNRLAAMMADVLITPVSDSIVDLQGLKTYEKVLKQMSEATNTVITSKVVLSPIHPNRRNLSDVKAFIEKSEHFEVFDTVLRRRKEYINSLGEGKSVVEYAKDSEASREVQALVKEIIKTLSI